MQIGTQQRSDQKFLRALAIIRDGRIGNVKSIVCSVGGAPTSAELPATQPPKNLDWNLWLGPTPLVPFHHLAGPNGETQSHDQGNGILLSLQWV